MSPLNTYGILGRVLDLLIEVLLLKTCNYYA